MSNVGVHKTVAQERYLGSSTDRELHGVLRLRVSYKSVHRLMIQI